MEHSTSVAICWQHHRCETAATLTVPMRPRWIGQTFSIPLSQHRELDSHTALALAEGISRFLDLVDLCPSCPQCLAPWDFCDC